MFKKRALLWSSFLAFSPGPEPEKQDNKNCAGQIGGKVLRIADPTGNVPLAVFIEGCKPGDEEGGADDHRPAQLSSPMSHVIRRPRSRQAPIRK